MAGHSKWAQIKHKKAISDAKKGQLFSKLIREITVAAREAEPNPDANPRLRAAIERGRSAGLPRDNIERAIERAAGESGGEAFSEFLYEATAPGGTAMLIEGITDNKNRTLAEIKHLLAEYGARLAEPGSLIWNFGKIGLLECRPAQHTPKTKEEAELAIIESGAADFKSIGDQAGGEAWMVETAFTQREKVRQALEAQGIAIKETGHDYKPKIALSLTDEERAKIGPLLDALLEQDDVQEVYTNINE